MQTRTQTLVLPGIQSYKVSWGNRDRCRIGLAAPSRSSRRPPPAARTLLVTGISGRLACPPQVSLMDWIFCIAESVRLLRPCASHLNDLHETRQRQSGCSAWCRASRAGSSRLFRTQKGLGTKDAPVATRHHGKRIIGLTDPSARASSQGISNSERESVEMLLSHSGQPGTH